MPGLEVAHATDQLPRVRRPPTAAGGADTQRPHLPFERQDAESEACPVIAAATDAIGPRAMTPTATAQTPTVPSTTRTGDERPMGSGPGTPQP